MRIPHSCLADAASVSAVLLFVMTTPAPSATAAPAAQLKLETSAPLGITWLSWDTEGTGRERDNLLRKGTAVTLQMPLADGPTTVPLARDPAEKSDGVASWSVKAADGGLDISIRAGFGAPPCQLVFPFDPLVTPTTAISAAVEADRSLRLPAIVSAPDFGQMLLTADSVAPLHARLEGSRTGKVVDLIVTIPAEFDGSVELRLRPLHLDAPKGIAADDPYWRKARRGWFNVFQPTAKWGGEGHKFSAPAGVLGNNVISDPVSFARWTYADAAFWTPQGATDVSLMSHVRQTLDWWLDERTSTTGECVGYWAYYDFLDSNPSLIISAWDYVESTGDTAWLEGRIERLEELSAFLESRDTDGDGLVEAVQSGDRGTLQQPDRSSCWWDALNVGHKDGFSNALIYRAWRCLADLELKLGRDEQAKRYTTLAGRLKAAYAAALRNPETGWLGWWRSADGELHDYAFPQLNALAIEYGLVEKDEARQILQRLREKARTAGFRRNDLGIPSTLIPVRRSDYLLPDSLGCPKNEDGTDSFGHYMNGGISAGHSLHWMMAHHRVGESEYADAFLREMLKRQEQGGFQNGVTDEAPRGIDWTDWEGKPNGYEGYLSDNYRFLQAAALRNPELRKRFYRPLFSGAGAE